MALELKHIAPYLPYGLKGIHDMPEYSILNQVVEVESLNEECITFKGLGFSDYYFNDNERENNFKPILRNLSELTKEIEHNGEKFVPMEEMLRANKHEFKELPLITKCETKIYERDNDTFCTICTIEYLNNDKSVSSFSYSSQYRRFIDRNETYGKPYATPYQYDLFEMLYKWKFDIFGLIPQGLAIDVNTLTINPY